MFDVKLYKQLQIQVLPQEMEKHRIAYAGFPAWETKAQRARRIARMVKENSFSPAAPSVCTDGTEVQVWDSLKWPKDEWGRPVPDGCAYRYKAKGWKATWG